MVDAAPYFLVEEPPPGASEISIFLVHFLHAATTLRDHVTRGRDFALCVSISGSSASPLNEERREGVSSNLATERRFRPERGERGMSLEEEEAEGRRREGGFR